MRLFSEVDFDEDSYLAVYESESAYSDGKGHIANFINWMKNVNMLIIFVIWMNDVMNNSNY